MIFHWYGLILGIAITTGVVSAQWLLARVHAAHAKHADDLALWTIIGGIIGARAYHIFTDWQLYVGATFLDYIAVWNGGLGLWGAVAGGLFAALLYTKVHGLWKHILLFFDGIGFGLPIAQAIGRFGNAINQEVYGKVTTLPWGISVYGSQEKYHPLFAYEMIGLFTLWIMMWRLVVGKRISLSEGKVFGIWLVWYGILRFFLEYLRFSTAMFGIFSVAQWIALCASIIGIIMIDKRHVWTRLLGGIALFALVVTAWSMRTTYVNMRVGTSLLRVETAQSASAIEKGLGDRASIGSDGMLFILPTRTTPSFWMKGMQFALDFVWIDTDHVVDLHTNVLPPANNQNTQALPTYHPKSLVTHVLELPAGDVVRRNITIGDSVQFEVR